MLNNQTKKATNIKAIMNNPQLSKLIADALKAPLGSTKREQAKSVLASLNKTGQNRINDGQGGAPTFSLQGNTNYLQGNTNQLQGSVNPMQQAQTTPTTPTQSLNVSSTPYQDYSNTLNVTNQPSTIPQRIDVVPGLPLPTKSTASASTISGVAEPPYGMTREGLLQWNRENPDAFSGWLSGVSGVQEEELTKPGGIPSGMWSDLKSSVEGNIGEETWKYLALPKLKEWFPDVPESELPLGAIWTDEIPAIRERLNEEYQLNSLLDNVQRLDAQGLTIESDLQAYVRGRDKYIKNINSMIDNVNDIYTDRDVSDPRVRSMLDKYRNYLYMSKGRQEVRYNEYVDRSIKEHEYRLKRATDTYNSNLKQFESTLADEKNITEERYDMFSSMLKDLYNSLDEREDELTKISENRLEQLYNDYKSLDGIIGYLTGTGDTDLEMTASEKSKSLTNYINSSNLSAEDAQTKWNNLSSAEKRKWINSQQEYTRDQMIAKIKSFQNEESKVEDIEEFIRLSGYAVEDFEDIMKDYKVYPWWMPVRFRK